MSYINDVDIDVAHHITKKIAGIMFVGLRKIHYNVMTRIMDMNEADILAGRAKSELTTCRSDFP